MTGYFVVGMGSNLGSREAFLRAAELLLASHPELTVAARSALYRTDPVGPPQPDYLNAALRLETELPPLALLDVLLETEAALGRVRRVRWGPRTLDLDVLAWSEGAFAHPRLTIPHPHLRERSFALAPLLDVAPELTPTFGPSLRERPERRPWTEPRRRGGAVLARALDPADAWALGATAWRGSPERVVATRRFRGAPGRLEPFARRALTVLERLDGDAAQGWRLEGREAALEAGPASVTTGPAEARFEAPKLL